MEETPASPASLAERFLEKRHVAIAMSEGAGVKCLIARELASATENVIRELGNISPPPFETPLSDIVSWHHGENLRADLVEAIDVKAVGVDWPTLGMLCVEGEFAWLVTIYRGPSTLFKHDIRVFEFGGNIAGGYCQGWRPAGGAKEVLYIRAFEYVAGKFSDALVERLAFASAARALEKFDDKA